MILRIRNLGALGGLTIAAGRQPQTLQGMSNIIRSVKPGRRDRMVRIIWFSWLVAAAWVSPALAADWTTYVNDRFGATADIPASYKPGEAPPNDDGLSFTSPEGDAAIFVWGALATVENENFADYAKRLISYDKDDGWDVSYSTGKDDWYVFSGSKADRIFYEKVVKACNGEIANHVRLEYPAAHKAEFDPIVEHVTKSLRSGEGWQC